MKIENVKFVMFKRTSSVFFFFLLESPLYAELRKRYINKYYWRRPNMPKFIQLLCTEHCKTLKNLSVFIEKAFQLRKEAVLF